MSEFCAGGTHLFVLCEITGIHLRKTLHRASVMSGETDWATKKLAAVDDKLIFKSKSARQLPQT